MTGEPIQPPAWLFHPVRSARCCAAATPLGRSSAPQLPEASHVSL